MALNGGDGRGGFLSWVSPGNIITVIVLFTSLAIWGVRLEGHVNQNERDIGVNENLLKRHEELDAHPNARARIATLESRVSVIERDLQACEDQDGDMNRRFDDLLRALQEHDRGDSRLHQAQ